MASKTIEIYKKLGSLKDPDEDLLLASGISIVAEQFSHPLTLDDGAYQLYACLRDGTDLSTPSAYVNITVDSVYNDVTFNYKDYSEFSHNQNIKFSWILNNESPWKMGIYLDISNYDSSTFVDLYELYYGEETIYSIESVKFYSLLTSGRNECRLHVSLVNGDGNPYDTMLHFNIYK